MHLLCSICRPGGTRRDISYGFTLAKTLSLVAQIFNLPYRRIAFGWALDTPRRLGLSSLPQIANLRYGRMQFCATSGEVREAVEPVPTAADGYRLERLSSTARRVLVTLLIVFTPQTVQADQTWEYSVQVSAQIQTSPPQITLTWPQDTIAIPDSYTVSQKAPGDSSWGTGIVLPGTTTSFADSGVSVGTIYEYQIAKTNAARGYGGYGYIYAGINAPLVENRGKVLLVVDNTYSSSLASELGRLVQDLVGDGWTVVRRDVARNDSVVNVKNLIRSEYSADAANVRALFLFGHVPVPYAGEIEPDGHPEHHGAWPADAYYGDMDGVWTDVVVASTVAESPRNWNTPSAAAAILHADGNPFRRLQRSRSSKQSTCPARSLAGSGMAAAIPARLSQAKGFTSRSISC